MRLGIWKERNQGTRAGPNQTTAEDPAHRRGRYSTVQSSRAESSGVPTNGQMKQEDPRSRSGVAARRGTLLSIAAGVLAAVLVLGGGAFLLFGTGKKWAGQTTVVVLPGKEIAIGPSASYWDTLSQGQITSTVAKVLALPRFKELAGQSLHLSPAKIAAVSVSAQQVTGTALVTVTAQGPDGSDAANMSDAVVAQATPAVNGLIAPYSVTVVSKTGGHASLSATTSTSKYLVILAVVSVALAFGVQQGVMQLLGTRPRHNRNRTGLEAPGATPARTTSTSSPGPVVIHHQEPAGVRINPPSPARPTENRHFAVLLTTSARHDAEARTFDGYRSNGMATGYRGAATGTTDPPEAANESDDGSS